MGNFESLTYTKICGIKLGIFKFVIYQTSIFHSANLAFYLI